MRSNFPTAWVASSLALATLLSQAAASPVNASIAISNLQDSSFEQLNVHCPVNRLPRHRARGTTTTTSDANRASKPTHPPTLDFGCDNNKTLLCHLCVFVGVCTPHNPPDGPGEPAAAPTEPTTTSTALLSTSSSTTVPTSTPKQTRRKSKSTKTKTRVLLITQRRPRLLPLPDRRRARIAVR